MSSLTQTEPFPTLSPTNSDLNAERNARPSQDVAQNRRSSSSARPTRGASLVQTFVTSNPPLGMWQATGEVGSKIPTLPEIRDGAFSDGGWSQEGQMERRGTNPYEIHRRTRARISSASTRTKDNTKSKVQTDGAHLSQATMEEESLQNTEQGLPEPVKQPKATDVVQIEPAQSPVQGPDETGTYPNGYRFPKKHTFGQSCSIGLKAFGKFALTPLGFAITVYGLLVVGWGAMIFFVLLTAVPRSWCQPSCSDNRSIRSLWVEIDSQVLNGLFCVTGFGLIPWRFRDFYYLMRWRIGKSQRYHRKLAGIYRGWYRLPGSNHLPEDLAPPPVFNKKRPQTDDCPPPYTEEDISKLEGNEALPLPVTSIPEPPLTGVRAQPTASWNLDVVIWMYMWNTFIQGGLAGAMWGLNRFNRPSAVTGVLISVGCVTGMVAGWVTFKEGSKVKKAEGIPVYEYDVLESAEEYHARKAKEEAKEAKKDAKQPRRVLSSDGRKIEKTEKSKGDSWFVRH